MTVSTENEPNPKISKIENLDSPAQIPIEPQSQFELIPRDTNNSEFSVLMDFGGDSFSVKTVT